MMTLTSVFIIARIVTTQFVRPKRWILQDAIVYFAFVLYIIMAVLYILVTPILFRLTAVGEKRLKPYPNLKNEHKFMVKVFFVNSMMLWFILWTIKFSFLVLYKRLMEGLRDVYFKLWWAVSVFCFLVCQPLRTLLNIRCSDIPYSLWSVVSPRTVRYFHTLHIDYL